MSKQESPYHRSSPASLRTVSQLWRRAHPTSTCLTAVIGSPCVPLLKGFAVVQRPQSARLSQPCCNGSVWDTPALPNSAGLDRVRQGRRSRQPGGDAFGIEIPEFAPILPIETGARERRVRQPGDRDVVEDVVAREAFGFSPKDA